MAELEAMNNYFGFWNEAIRQWPKAFPIVGRKRSPGKCAAGMNMKITGLGKCLLQLIMVVQFVFS